MMHPLFLGTDPTSPFGRGLGDVAAISYAITQNIHVGLTSPCPLHKGEAKDSIRHLLKERCLSTLGEVRVNDMTFSEDYRVIRVIRA